jgi:2,4-dienoyl-CoA reductase-like NADH-dependent reductase (Old Yellow Enzyme family)
MEGLGKAFSPMRMRGLELRNRFIKSATYEGMCRSGYPTPQLIDWHARLASGGVGMTTVAYGAVSPEARTNQEQLLMTEDVIPSLGTLTGAIHSHGSAAMLQLTHCGYFTKNSCMRFKRPKSASRVLNKYGALNGVVFSQSMNRQDMRQTASDFGKAAQLAQTAGFDAVEIHMGHGYLLSQFLSPRTNRRKDDYGGPLMNRLRFPLEVAEDIRKAVGDDFPVLCKINMDDGFKGGLTITESIEVARTLQKAGVDALVLSGGFTSLTPYYLMRGEVPLWEMMKAEKDIPIKLAMALFGKAIIRKYEFEENFFLPLARKIREAVTLPLAYLGGVSSASGIRQIMEAGFDLVALARALIHDPDFIHNIRNGSVKRSECNHCNICVAEMDRGGVKCALTVDG